MKTKKFVSNPENLTPELLEGLVEAHEELVALGEDRMIVNNELVEADRVTIMTQGRSGREPAISGFVGEEMVDISMVGDVFAAPGPQAYLGAIKLADKGRGVPYVVLNHVGGTFTGSLIMKRCAKEGLSVVEVVTQEDIASTPCFSADDRRGLVGYIPTHKVAGTTTAEGRNLGEVTTIAQRFADNMATLAVAISGATHPAIGSLLAGLGEDETRIGMGQREEDGDERQTMESADETAEIMLDGLLIDLGIRKDEKIMLILNRTGATTLTELFIIYRRCVSYLKEKSIETVSSYVGEPFTVQEQADSQMFTARTDDEPLYYWSAPYNTPYMER